MRRYVPAVTAGVAVALIGLTGCGGSKSSGPAASDTSASQRTTAQFEVGDTLNYGSFGTTADLDCADGKTLDVGGANNTLTVTGTCATVRVVGSDNKLTIAQVDKAITLLGINNTVTYKSGDPEVEDHGSGNTVHKG